MYFPVLYLQKEQTQGNWKTRERPEIKPAAKRESKAHIVITCKSQEIEVQS